MQEKTQQELQEMEKCALKAEKQRDDALDKVKELQHQFYETAVRLEEEQGKNLKLRAQINRDHENSSMDNEPDRTWNKEMRSLVQEMIHFWNGSQPSEEPDSHKVSEFEERY